MAAQHTPAVLEARSPLHPSALPVTLTSFVGREHEIERIVERLRREDARLVTLTGPGGVGKTRIAIEAAAAADFPDGVWFVPLAPVRDADLVASTLARTLGIFEAPDRLLDDSIADYLTGRRALLVLDNFEHVLAAGPLITTLLTACPMVKALVTSRVVLNLSGEHTIAIAPFATVNPELVPAFARLCEAEAVRLFDERATAAHPDFALTDDNVRDVAVLCDRLDGLPLAIELAAARVRALPPRTMLQRLDQRLALLTGGPQDQPDRLRTMHDAIAWSYDLLTPEEQALFRRMAVFVGGFRLEAAESVVAMADSRHLDAVGGIASLVDKSLLRAESGDDADPRYTMLETIREFALDRLDACGEAEPARAAHAAFFLTFAEAATPGPFTSIETAWLDRLGADRDNLGAAFAWLSDRGQVEESLRLAVACAPYSALREHRREGRARLERALSLAGPAPTMLRGLALHYACEAALVTGDLTSAAALSSEALAVANVVGDQRARALAMQTAGWVEEIAGRFDTAVELFRAALVAWREAGDQMDVARTLVGLIGPTIGLGELVEARALTEEADVIFRDAGHRDWLAATAWYLGLIASKEGRLAVASRHYADALRHAVVGEARHAQAQVLVGLAAIAVESGQAEIAAGLLGAVDARLDRDGAELFLFARQILAHAEGGLRKVQGDARPPARAAGQALSQERVIELANEIVSAAETAERVRQARTQKCVGDLTSRERDILRLVADGFSDRDVAAALFIGPGTVHSHLARVYGKLGVGSRTAAVAAARRLGIL